MRGAKLDYLENVTENRLAHPYYWGSLTSLGNQQPITFKKTVAWWWIALAASALAGVVLWQVRKVKRGVITKSKPA